MRGKTLPVAVAIVVLAGLVPAALSAGQGNSSDAQRYAGAWAGSYTNDGGVTNKVAFSLKRDEKGVWGGSVKWVNQEGEQAADFMSLQIANGNMKGKIESSDGQVEVTIEGQLKGENLEGTYAVSPKGSTEVAERGTWKVTKSAAAKSSGGLRSSPSA